MAEEIPPLARFAPSVGMTERDVIPAGAVHGTAHSVIPAGAVHGTAHSVIPTGAVHGTAEWRDLPGIVTHRGGPHRAVAPTEAHSLASAG